MATRILTLVLALAAPLVPGPAAPPDAGATGPPAAVIAAAVKPAAGDAKTACIYSHNSIRELTAIGRRIGRALDCASIYNSAATWRDWENPWFLHHGDPDYGWPAWVRADPGRRRMIIGQTMIPTDGVAADWRIRGAGGAYDAHIRRLGRHLVAAGLGRSVIRLGYEANGDWNVDNVGRSASDFRTWRAYWARFARVLDTVPGAAFTMDWNLNSAYRDIPLERIYPGDRAVDIVGIDVYDSAGPRLPAPASPRRWRAISSQPGGVRDVVAFARRHGKPLSVPEWGLVRAAHGGGGDNPRFVAAIARLVRDNRVAYQSYFNNDELAACLEIQKNRRAFAVYARAFGRASSASGAPARRSERSRPG